MNIKEIRDAALNGKTFTIKNVPIESIEFGNIQSCIDGLGHPVLFKTVNIKFVSPDIIDSVYSDNNDYPNIEVCEKPKYDPCRKLKKGDIVKKRWVDGRTDINFPFDKPCEVYSDEDMYGNIRVQTAPSVTSITRAVFVELVTPVEEREPYSVIDSPQTYNIVREGKKGFVATFYKNQHIAKQEAERYCNRLNEEWRKEQQ